MSYIYYEQYLLWIINNNTNHNNYQVNSIKVQVAIRSIRSFFICAPQTFVYLLEHSPEHWNCENNTDDSDNVCDRRGIIKLEKQSPDWDARPHLNYGATWTTTYFWLRYKATMTMANEEAKYTFNWSEKMATLSKVVTTMAQAMKYKRVMLEPCLITDDIIRPTDAWMVGVCWCVLGVRWGVFSWNQSMMGQWEGGVWWSWRNEVGGCWWQGWFVLYSKKDC